MGQNYNVTPAGSVRAAGDSRSATVTLSQDAADAAFPTITMTSDTTPSPYVMSASNAGGTNQAFLAMDGNDTTQWAKPFAGSTTEWIKIDLASALQADAARVAQNTGGITNWSIQGSNDDAAWTTVFTQAADMSATPVVVNFTQNIAPYRYYRMIGTLGAFSGMSVFELQGAAVASPQWSRSGSDAILSTQGSERLRGTSYGVSIPGNIALGGSSAPQRLTIAGDSISSSAISINTYTADNSVGQLSSVKYRGTEVSPTAILSGDFIMDWRMGGRDDVGVGLGTQLFATATENWSSTARGSQFTIASSKTGSVTTDNALRIDGSNNVRVYESLGVGLDPTAKFEVSGNVKISGNSQLQIFNAAGTSGVSIQTDNAASTAMTFSTGGSERASISNAGAFRVNALTSGRVESSSAGVISSQAPVFARSNQNVASNALATAYTTIPGCTLTLTVPGTYKIEYCARASFDAATKYASFRLQNTTAGTTEPQSQMLGSFSNTVADIQTVSTNSVFVTITGSTSFALQGKINGGTSGVSTLDDTSGRTYIMAHRI